MVTRLLRFSAALFLVSIVSVNFAIAKTESEQIAELKEKAQFLSNKKKFKEAIAESEQALKLNSRDASIYYLRARIRESQKDPLAAMKELNKAIELNPKYAEAYLLRAKGYYFLAEVDEGRDNIARAKRDLDTALKLNPQLAEGHDFKGVGLANEDKPLEALIHFNKAVQLDKSSSRYLEHRA
ncbi:MAG TPA: hypothetical protein PKW73_13950, partial [Candidatus Obscuribacter sp.]|nr:hypothetical protein [Candidatus Obscuribacter sp.]